MTNRVRIRNEGAASLDANGKKIIIGHYPVEWNTASGNKVLWGTGSENKLLWKPDQNCCCAAECGHCVDTLPEQVTVDLGTTNWTSNDQAFYYTTCKTPCEDLEGEFVLTWAEGSSAFCKWVYESPLCYTVFQNWFIPDIATTYTTRIEATIRYNTDTLVWIWEVAFYMRETNDSSSSILLWGGGYVKYSNPTTTSCTGMKTLDFESKSPANFDTVNFPGSWDYKPCVDYPENSPDFRTAWTWPTSIDLTV